MGFNHFRQRKGQSATEYLMTYGWALLAIAVVGGLLYMYVFSNKECTQVVKGFSSPGVIVLPAPNYVVHSDGTIKFVIQNKLDDNVTITGIVADGVSLTPPGDPLAPGQKATITGTINPANEGSCKEIKVSITYDVSGGISGAVNTGTLIAKVVK